MISNYLSFLKGNGAFIARIFVGGLFVFAGIQKFMDIAGTAGYIGSINFPAPVFFAWVAAVIETFAGLAIIVGMKFREAALILAIFVFIIDFLFHSPADAKQRMMFLKDLSIVGALLYMAAFGPGTGWKMDKEG